MAPGARSKFGVPMFEPEFFRKQMYCIEESICDNIGIVWRPPQWFGAHLSWFRARRVGPLLLLSLRPCAH